MTDLNNEYTFKFSEPEVMVIITAMKKLLDDYQIEAETEEIIDVLGNKFADVVGSEEKLKTWGPYQC